MEEIDSDFSDDDFDGFIDEMMKMKKNDNFLNKETSNVTTIFSSSGTTSSPTPPTNNADTSIPQYQEKPGLTTQLSRAEPVIYFKHLWTDTLSNKILKQTNLYGQQYLQSHVDYLDEHPRARAHDFSKCTFTLGELYNFLSLIITMGIVSLPSIPSYWHTSWSFLNDSFHKVMSCDRFLLLLKFLHLSDNEKYISFGQAGHDRLYKIQPIITHLNAQFKSSYTPNQNCSIDESIISYKGRLSFLQYLPKKPHKWGIKAWALVDAKSGYTWNLDIYTGRSHERDANLPLSSHVVLSLATDLLGKGYNFFFDNFYKSPDLCKRLYENGSGSCGTVSLNRKGIPDWFKRKHVEKGKVITYRDGCILGIKWMDKSCSCPFYY